MGERVRCHNLASAAAGRQYLRDFIQIGLWPAPSCDLDDFFLEEFKSARHPAGRSIRWGEEAVTESREMLLSKLGFRFGTNGPHAARTMMLDDLRLLFAAVPANAPRFAYAEAVVGANVLGKPTKKARELALKHLSTLYALDPGVAVFRALRRLWRLSESGHPLLALLVALARDPLLRGTQAFILAKEQGSLVLRAELEDRLALEQPERFSAASLKSFAQNVNGTWTSAGFLKGRIRKVRSQPAVTPAVITLALFLGFLEGLSGQRLFSSNWMKLLPGNQLEFESLVGVAAQQDALVFLNAGGVKEVRFPGYLTPAEEQIRQEASLVI